MKRLACAVATAGLFVSGTAAAKAGDVYTYGNYTYSNFNGANASLDDDNIRNSQNHDGIGFGAGYKFSDRFSVELGYKNLGKIKNHYKNPKYENDESDVLSFYNHGTETWKSKALVLRGIYLQPITQRITLEGSIGLGIRRENYKNNDIDESLQVGREHTDYSSESKTRTSLIPIFGVGASYAMTEHLSGFARYEYVHKAIDTKLLLESSAIHASTFDLGVRYTF